MAARRDRIGSNGSALTGAGRHFFRRRQRLLDESAFQRVFDKPKKSVDRWLVVLARENDATQARLGLAIAKKHLRRAVDRNRIKRLVRESFRLHQQQLQGLDVIVLCRPAIASQTRASIHRALDKHWQKINSICKNSS